MGPSDEPEPADVQKWVKITGGPFTKADNFCADLRRLQQRCGCSDVACDDFLSTFAKYFGGVQTPKNFRDYDKKMRKEAGAQMLRLNGCVHCKKHVFLPTDKSKECPLCGHSRYDDQGQPREVRIVLDLNEFSYILFPCLQRVFYFPMKRRLEALLRVPSYSKMLQHEFSRPKNDHLMSDVYDSPAWKTFMGEAVFPNNRIGVCCGGWRW